jgi:hypothetical protein
MIFVIVSVIVGLVALVAGYVGWCFWILKEEDDSCATCGATGGKRYATIAPSDALVCEHCARDELRAMHVNENILCAATHKLCAAARAAARLPVSLEQRVDVIVGAYETQEGFKPDELNCKCNAYDGLGSIHLPTCHLSPIFIDDDLHLTANVMEALVANNCPGYIDKTVELTEEQLQEIRSNLDKPFSTPLSAPVQSNGDNAFGGIEEFGAIDDESWMTAGGVVDSDLGLITYPTKTHRYHIAGVAVTKEAFQWAQWIVGRRT